MQEHQLKKKYWRKCDMAQTVGDIPPPPERPMDRVELRARLFLWNRSDWDNLVARMKWPVDWLVTRGYLTDDSPKNVDGWRVSQDIDRSDRRVEIEIREAA